QSLRKNNGFGVSCCQMLIDMLKNVTPRQVALYAGGAITSVVILILLVLKYTSLLQAQIGLILLLAPVFMLLTYAVILYGVRHYLYRRIKLIYKNIHRQKLASKDRNNDIDVDTDIIEDVEKEVEEWAMSQSKEIEDLKLLETYRRNFLGDISHELKTPLFNIQGYIHTLLDGGLYDNKINKSYLNRAAKNAERLQTIVKDLEEISRLESGELVLEMERFDLRELVVEVLEDLELRGRKRKIQLVFKEGADRPYIVRADRKNIRNVLNNLVINSIKYGKEGGQTKVGFYDMDSNILVEVADNGLGIEEKHLSRLFDRFYRVEKSRARDQGGSGLGLSIVKHIIEAHKQTINVRSTPDVGSTFGFTLEKSKVGRRS
ncbi:MAG: ATP-binding protein, partial [Bacteroidota bacterium]